MKSTILLLLGFIISFETMAQMPECAGGSIGYVYFKKGNDIYKYNTVTDTAILLNISVNPIPVPSNPGGLAIVPELNMTTMQYDFTWATTTSNGSSLVYTIYDSTTNAWNMTNTSIESSAVNLGGSCTGSLYSYSGNSGIYHAFGLATASSSIPIVSNISSNGGQSIYDIVGDVDGNCYILVTKNGSMARGFYKYDPTGTLLQSWNITGIDSSFGAGLAIAGGKIYANRSSNLWIGTLSGNSINFVLHSLSINGMPGQADDCATCPNIPAFGGTATTLQANCSVNPTSVSNYFNDFEISSISPNPATNRISVNVNSQTKDELKISILSMNGQRIYDENWPLAQGINRIDLNNLNFAPGVYFIKLSNKESKELVRKVVFN